jgi:hypothetical protein
MHLSVESHQNGQLCFVSIFLVMFSADNGAIGSAMSSAGRKPSQKENNAGSDTSYLVV